MNAYIRSWLIKVSGQKRWQIQRNWRGKGPSIIVEYKSTSLEWTHLVHRIKVDELAGYIMTTSNQGGILVTDLNQDCLLWALPPVCKYFHSLNFFLFISYNSGMSVNTLIWSMDKDI